MHTPSLLILLISLARLAAAAASAASASASLSPPSNTTDTTTTITTLTATDTETDTDTDTDTETDPPPKDAPQDAPVKIWTLDQMSRTPHHKGSTCRWRFTVTETHSPPSWNDTDTSVKCRFKIRVARHHDCRAANFGLTPCSETNPDYFISGGHDRNGMVVLAVENMAENARAFFGYLDASLDSHDEIPPQSSPIEPRQDKPKPPPKSPSLTR
ncbi:hypothetical protein F4859DRAFT_508220 [Xylaria cf. heliscus]|nr:hypothetical protein F4859DRAFT_508220 [Xylaria cf. heliscus]